MGPELGGKDTAVLAGEATVEVIDLAEYELPLLEDLYAELADNPPDQVISL